MDELLKLFGVKDLTYDELTKEERETFHMWVDGLRKSTLTTDNVKDYVRQLRDSVELELTKPGLTHDNDLFLKARLRNLMLIDAMLTLPEKAQKLLKKQVSQQ